MIRVINYYNSLADVQIYSKESKMYTNTIGINYNLTR